MANFQPEYISIPETDYISISSLSLILEQSQLIEGVRLISYCLIIMDHFVKCNMFTCMFERILEHG